MELIGQGKAKLSLLPMVREALSGLPQASRKKKLRRVIQKMRILMLFVFHQRLKCPAEMIEAGRRSSKKRSSAISSATRPWVRLRRSVSLARSIASVVATLEGVTLTPLTLNQRVADEHFTSELGSGDWALLGDRKRRICGNSASD